jgi:hypothetical protein
VKLASVRPLARAGFTIVEVVVAMGLFLLGMSSILGLLAFGAALTRTAALKNDGSAAVEAIAAELEASLFPLVKEPDGSTEVGEPREIVDRPLTGHPGVVYSATAKPLSSASSVGGSPLEYRVDVEISWQTGGQKKTRSFSTLLLREVPFGERLRKQFVEAQE